MAENLTYLPFGPLTGYDAGSGTHVENAFDTRYRLAGITAGTLMDLGYTMDAVGNITAIADGIDAAKNQSFGYDDLYRLTSAGGAYGTIGYTYDDVGNRLTKTENGQTDTFQYIAGTNRLQQVSGANPQSFTFDSAGNMTSAGSRSYVYNHNNRLIQVNENATTLGDFTYNANGQRIKKATANGTVIFHYDLAGNTIAESTPDGDFTATYIYLGSLRLAAVAATPLDEIKVFVTTSEGATLAGINVYAFTENAVYTGKSAVTDEAGKAVFNPDEFADGNYKFRADYLSDPFWSGVVALPGTSAADIVIAEEPVTIQVTQAGAPKEGVMVYLFNETGTYLGIVETTDENGNVYFNLPSGQGYKFRADVLGSQFMSDTLTITSGGTNSFTVATGGGTLTVKLEKDDQAAINGINMYLFSSLGTYLGLSGQSDAQGEVFFNVPSGSYMVRADYLGYQFWSAEISVAANQSATLTIPHQDVIIRVQGDLDGDIQARESVPVHIFTASGTYLGINGTSDSQGQVTFNLPAQEYKVRADYRTQQFWSQVFNQSDQTVTIEEAAAELTVTGLGLALPDVNVYAFNAAGSYLGLNGSTDSAGTVSFLVPEGTYKFRVDHGGSQIWSDVVNILAHEETVVEMDLDVLMSDLTRNPNPVRFDGVAPKYEPEKLMVATIGSLTGMLPQLVAGQTTVDKLYFYINDHLGTPQIMTDDAGAVVWEADYKPFGDANVNPNSGVVNNFRYAGQYFDEETGLHYNYHRYYDPSIGRYLTADPIGLAGGVNLYAYVQNNPVNLIDPLGLEQVNLNISGTPTGNYALSWAYPDGNRSEYYYTPLYKLTVSSSRGSETFEGIRFGPRNKNGNLSVSGLADEQTHNLQWYPGYGLHSTSVAEPGAWIVYDNFLVHDGPDDFSQAFGTAGCVEVTGANGFSRLNNAILRLSGETNLHGVDAIIKYEAATRPPLSAFPRY